MPTNRHGQPVGPDLPGWTAPPAPAPVTLHGRWVRIEPLVAAHAADLYDATCGPGREAWWTYLADEMPASLPAFEEYVARRIATPGQVSLTLVSTRGRAAGLASLMRAEPVHGTVEVGNILFGGPLQRTTAATEAMVLLARHVFGAGYRRYEWKCDTLNAPSRAAAARLGFHFEGVFRQAVVTKGRSRDTAWFSVTDGDWPALDGAYARWLDLDNFADPGTGAGQRIALSVLTDPDRSPAP